MRQHGTVGEDVRHAWQVMDAAAARAGRQTLAAEIEAVRREARRRFAPFVLERANPGSRFRDRAGEALPKGLFAEAADIGLLGFSLPAELGGGGRDKLEWGVVVEEIAYHAQDPGFPVLLDITVETAELILSSGRPELIDRYVPGLVSGRIVGVPGAYENRDPYDYVSTARREGDTWVLNGAKRFVAGAQLADLFVLYVRDEDSNDMLAFALERDEPGVAPVRLETMGLRAMALGQVVMHDVRLPESRLVWRSDALSEMNTYARNRRLLSACGVVGALEALVENCVAALAARVRGGRPVLDYPNVERSVGEMRTLVETARAIVYRALDGTRSPERDPFFDALATAAKHTVSEHALRVGELVMNLQGGESYMTGFPWERFMRDALGLIGGQGSQELLLIQLGQRSIVSIEGRELRARAAEAAAARLGEAAWAVHALDLALERGWLGGDGAGAGTVPEAAGAVLEAAGLFRRERGALVPDASVERLVAGGGGARLGALLARGEGLAAAARDGALGDAAGRDGALPGAAPGGFDGRLGELLGAWRAQCLLALALDAGLLHELLAPCTAAGAAERTGLPEDLVETALEALAGARLVRADGARYVAADGLEPLLIGPRAPAFAAGVRRALRAGAELRGGGRDPGAGRGADAAALADAVADEVVLRLEGVEEVLDRPGARIACAAGDGGAFAVALSRRVPLAPAIALEPDPESAEAARAAAAGARDARVEVRAAGAADLAGGDSVGLAWLRADRLRRDELRPALEGVARALLPGGWALVAEPLAPRRRLGAAVSRLELALDGVEPLADGELAGLLRDAGLGLVRTAREEPGLGLRLLAARRR